MDRRRALALVSAIMIATFMVVPVSASFLGTSVNFNKDFASGVDVKVDKVAGLAGTAFGGADMDLGVNWNIPVDLTVTAGYPYGFGGIGVVTTGNMGYALGLSMDSTTGSGFDGSSFGIPQSEQAITTTHFDKLWAAQNSLDNTQAFLPFTSFPVL